MNIFILILTIKFTIKFINKNYIFIRTSNCGQIISQSLSKATNLILDVLSYRMASRCFPFPFKLLLILGCGLIRPLTTKLEVRNNKVFDYYVLVDDMYYVVCT